MARDTIHCDFEDDYVYYIQGVENVSTVNISSFRTTPNQTITFHVLTTCLLGSNHSLNYVDFIIKF